MTLLAAFLSLTSPWRSVFAQQRTLVVADLEHADLVGAIEQDRRDHLGKYGGSLVFLVVAFDRIVDQVLHLLGGHLLLRKRRRECSHGPGGQARSDQ